MPNPEGLFKLATGFWASKILFSAVKLNLFGALGNDRLTAEQLRTLLSLHPRAALDFFDSLVALGLLKREGRSYSNTPETAMFLVKSSPAYIGDLMMMSNERLWEFWGRLDEGLRTGLPQNETRNGGRWILDVLYGDPVKRDLFLKAMIGLSSGSSMVLAQTMDFTKVRTLCDVGGGPGTVGAAVRRAHPSVSYVNMDLPAVEPVFWEYVEKQGFGRGDMTFVPGDCFKDPLPQADVYAMGHLLHGWGPSPETDAILAKAYAALAPGGEVWIIESLIDDERRENVFGLMMSLDMLIETDRGRNFTGREVVSWMEKARYRDIVVKPLIGPHSLVVGRK